MIGYGKNIIMVRWEVALLLLSLLHVCGGCPSQYVFPTCTMQVNYLDASCFNFYFLSCQYLGYTASVVSSDWPTCSSLCCDSSLEYLQNADSMALCANFNKWSHTGDLIIITLVVVAFVLPSVVVMVWTLINCYRKCRNA